MMRLANDAINAAFTSQPDPCHMSYGMVIYILYADGNPSPYSLSFISTLALDIIMSGCNFFLSHVCVRSYL
jgi:hypothetical protein